MKMYKVVTKSLRVWGKVCNYFKITSVIYCVRLDA